MAGNKDNPKLVPPCPHCGGNCVRDGRAGNGKQRYECKVCGRKNLERTVRPPLTLPDGSLARCSYCQSPDMTRNGSCLGKPYFKCRACGRANYGVPLPHPVYPCPYCGEPCWKVGRNARGVQLYYCRACRRTNTNLFPEATSPGGPFPYHFTFCLDLVADTALEHYCQTRKRSPAEAFRAILREAATPPVAVVAVRGRVYRPPSPPPDESLLPPEGGRLDFPDLRPEAARLFASQSEDAFRLPTVYVTRQFSVALDRLAVIGLLVTMRRRNLNHQEAARTLVKDTYRRETRGQPSVGGADE